MPLINLRTNLKTTTEYTSTDPNLTYGHDRKDFGSSNQPYIVTPIPEGNDNVRSSPDFLLRNGYLNYVNSLNDIERITKFLDPFKQGASINGALFVAKQELLERQNVKVENGFNRIFNPLQPVLQAGVLSVGYHLNKQGFNVFKRGYYNDGQSGYFNITRNNNTDSRNRLALLYTIKTLGAQSPETTIKSRLINANLSPQENRNLSTLGLVLPVALLPGLGEIGTLLPFTNKRLALKQQNISAPANEIYGITGPEDNVNLIRYSGGPGSILGVGKTNIRIQNELKFKVISNSENPTPVYNDNLNSATTYLVPNAVNITRVYAKGYDRSFGSQTSFNRSRANSVNSPQSNTYKLNPNLSISPDQDFAEGEDIIDFSFTLINNEGINATDPNPNTFINFRAYIDDFSDSYTGDWDSYRYMGRAENFYRYKGFTREMSVSFTVPVLSRADMVTIYQKLNALTWLTMPDYSDAGIMRGNLAYFTMGDYLRRSIVVVKSLNYTPIMEMGFDINRAQDGTSLKFGAQEYTGQLPKGIKVSANIIPLTNAVSPNSPDNFYTPQRGEAFIGNRKHVIVDRDNIATQYGETLTSPTNGEPYVANDPTLSPLITPAPPFAPDEI